MDFRDDEPLTIHAEDHAPVRARAGGARAGADAFLLFLGGLGASGLAIALAFAPRLSPDLVRVGEKLASLGFSNGAILASGVMLTGLGLVARRRSQPIQLSVPRQSGSLDLVADRLPGQIEALSIHVAGLDQRVAESFEDLKQMQGAPEPPIDLEELIEAIAKRQNGALFRLAASLDQLGARLEKHLDARVTELANHLGHVIEQHAVASATTVPTPERAPETPEPSSTSLGVLDQLGEDSASGPPSAPAPVAAAPAPPPASSPQVVPVESAAPPMAARVHAPVQPPAPFPTQGHVPQPNAVGIQGSAEDLESLLPDYRVREAIDDDRVAR